MTFDRPAFKDVWRTLLSLRKDSTTESAGTSATGGGQEPAACEEEPSSTPGAEEAEATHEAPVPNDTPSLDGGVRTHALQRAGLVPAGNENFATDDSGFKQLWPLLPGAERRLALARKKSHITEVEARQIEEFAQRGYTIFPRAIEPEVIDALVTDVRRIGDHPGFFVTTDHKSGRSQRYAGSDFDSYESIYDTYVNFESARRVCFHPQIVRFLEVIFDGPPVAMQQLLFQRSNQHPLHQDTSVVCTEDPLLLVATWIALEDVVPGRGELTYYEGSHRIPHYFFADGTKRLDPSTDDPEAVRAHFDAQCARLGCKKKDFVARKGDVLFWAADLVHGSNPRTRPDTETRMSLVTHYHPEATQPFWFRFHPEHQTLQSYAGRARYASMYYRLPAGPDMCRPSYEIP